MTVIDLKHPINNISNLIIYRNLHYRQKYSFGDILKKFDGNYRFVKDPVCLLNSTPKFGILHAVLQILCHGQNCKFCHIESCGRNNVCLATLIKQ